jgi:acetolactate synthase-1/2/3 large subunit
MLGMHGTRAANIAVQELRSADRGRRALRRPRHRQAGRVRTRSRAVVHLDADAYGIGKLRSADMSPWSGEHGVIWIELALTQGWTQRARSLRYSDWRRRCVAQMRRTAPRARYDAPGQGVYAPALLKRNVRSWPRMRSCRLRRGPAPDVGGHALPLRHHPRKPT